jgi:fatty acid desaturase
MPGLWLLSLAGTLVYCGQWWVIVVWYLGTAMVFWPIFRLRVWTEHVGTDDAHRIHAPWYIRWWLLPHNTWHHYEHHHFPQVPCWNLPRLRALIGDTPAIVPLSAVLRALEQAPQTRSGVPLRRTDADAMGPDVLRIPSGASMPAESVEPQQAKAA